MEAMRARLSTRTPAARSLSPPPWNAFSMATAAPVQRLSVCQKIVDQQNPIVFI